MIEKARWVFYCPFSIVIITAYLGHVDTVWSRWFNWTLILKCCLEVCVWARTFLAEPSSSEEALVHLLLENRRRAGLSISATGTCSTSNPQISVWSCGSRHRVWVSVFKSWCWRQIAELYRLPCHWLANKLMVLVLQSGSDHLSWGCLGTEAKIGIAFLSSSRKVSMVRESVCCYSSWKELLVEEKKDVFVWKEKLNHFAFVGRCKMLVLDGSLEAVIVLRRAFAEWTVQIVILSERYSSSPLNILSSLFYAIKKQFFELVSPRVEISFFSFQVAVQLPFYFQMNLRKP